MDFIDSFKVRVAPTPNSVIIFTPQFIRDAWIRITRKKCRVSQHTSEKTECTYVSKRWGYVLSCAHEPVYWLLYHQNCNSMPSCKSVTCKYIWICVNLLTHVSFPDARRNYLQEAARESQRRACYYWRRVVCVYIFRGLVANHWRLSGTILRRTTTNEKRYYYHETLRL